MSYKRTPEQELSYISKYSGQSELLVQAGGGNTSVKLDDSQMIIKSSGFQLSEVTETSGFSLVDYKKITEYFDGNTPSADMEQEILNEALVEGKRPSIETFLHSITKKYTIHTHPFCVSVLASRNGGMDTLKSLFPNSLLVDYATPGIKLANKYYSVISQSNAVDIVFLENHGLIVSADTIEETLELQDQVIIKVSEYLGADTRIYKKNMRLFKALNKLDSSLIAYNINSADIDRAYLVAGGQWDYAFSPDCVVYCGSSFLVLNEDDDIQSKLSEHIWAYGMPKVILYDGSVFAVAQNVRKACEIRSVLDFTAKIFLSQPSGKTEILPQQEIGFLLNWDSEKYRSNL